MSEIAHTPNEAVEIEERKPLTPAQRARMWREQGGLCGCGCGARLVEGQTIDEHVLPLWLGGSNAASNRSLWAAECSAKKTAREATERGKVKWLIRQADPETRRRSPFRLRGRGFGGRDPLR